MKREFKVGDPVFTVITGSNQIINGKIVKIDDTEVRVLAEDFDSPLEFTASLSQLQHAGEKPILHT